MSSNYPIADPFSVTVRFIEPYTPPASEDITLDFSGASGEAGEVEILPGQSVFCIDSFAGEIETLTELISDPSEFSIYASDAEVETLIDLVPEPSEVAIHASAAQVETLIDLVPEPSEVAISAPSAELEILIDLVPEASETFIDSPKALVAEVFIIDSSDSKIQIESFNTEIETLVELEPESSELAIYISAQSIEHLPDVITAVSEFITTSGAKYVSGGQANDLPNKIGTGSLGMSWRETAKSVHRDFDTPWDKSIDIRTKDSISWVEPEKINGQTKSPYVNIMDCIDDHADIPWANFEHQSDAKNTSPYIGIMNYIDRFKKAEYGGFVTADDQRDFVYKVMQLLRGDFKDVHMHKPWDQPEHYDFHKKNTFNNDIREQFKTRHHGTYWGPYWYSMWCQEKFFPYNSDEEVQLVLKTDVPFMSNPDFVTPKNARCPFTFWYSGGRDSFKPVIDPSDQIFTERKKVYYMLNSAFIKRLPDNTSIDFQSVSMSIDRNSWSWDFNITLMSREALELVWPVGDTLVDIEININGWKWTCRVENWSESVSFGQRAWSVSGRSPSVELGEPYLVEPSFANVEEHGGQIVDSILENTGWSANWSYDDFNPYVDWLVPASTLNMYDSSKIQQMQSIVEAVGAFIQTVPDTNTSQEFIIHPTYKANPWNWGSQITPTVYLNDAVCYEYGRSNNIVKAVNSVIVSGENAGVVVDATKDGTAGDSPAAMIINSLITSQEAATERARHEIGKTGFWINHSMRLFSLMPPGEAPGLMLPGTFINMSETGFTAWVGQVTGTQISAGWENGLEVSQQIEVEQFYG